MTVCHLPPIVFIAIFLLSSFVLCHRFCFVIVCVLSSFVFCHRSSFYRFSFLIVCILIVLLLTVFLFRLFTHLSSFNRISFPIVCLLLVLLLTVFLNQSFVFCNRSSFLTVYLLSSFVFCRLHFFLLSHLPYFVSLFTGFVLPTAAHDTRNSWRFFPRPISERNSNGQKRNIIGTVGEQKENHRYLSLFGGSVSRI